MVDLYVNNNIIKNVSAVLFDKDGTIIDSNEYWGEIIKRRAKEIIKHLNLNEEQFEKICNVLGFNLNSGVLLEKGPIAIYSREKVITILCSYLEEIEVKYSQNEILDIFNLVHNEFKEQMLNYIKILPFVSEFMKVLKDNGVKLAVVTSDTEINSKKILDYLELTNLIDVIVGKDTIPYEKSTGIPAKEALRLLGENNLNAICIGDTITDIVMAKRSNCLAAISVATGQISEKELKKDSKFVVRNIGEIGVH